MPVAKRLTYKSYILLYFLCTLSFTGDTICLNSSGLKWDSPTLHQNGDSANEILIGNVMRDVIFNLHISHANEILIGSVIFNLHISRGFIDLVDHYIYSNGSIKFVEHRSQKRQNAPFTTLVFKLFSAIPKYRFK